MSPARTPSSASPPLAAPSTASWASSWRTTYAIICLASPSPRKKQPTMSSTSSALTSNEVEDGRLSPKFSISFLHQVPAAGIKEPEGETSVTRIFTALVFAVFFNALAVRAQAGPVEGGHELQFWTGGGHGSKRRPAVNAALDGGF